MTKHMDVFREFDLVGDGPDKVIARLSYPVPKGDDFRCEFSIEGLDVPINHYLIGVDRLQSLQLTLELIGTHLYLSNEYAEHRLTYFGSRDLRLPVPKTIADVLPPKEA